MWQHRSSRFSATHAGQHGGPEAEKQSGAVSEWVRQGRESLQVAVSDYPFAVILGSFAVGAAVGVAIGSMLGETAEPRWYERIPESLGRRWVESFFEALPESIKSKVS